MMANFSQHSMTSSLMSYADVEIGRSEPEMCTSAYEDKNPWRGRIFERHGSSDCIVELKEEFKRVPQSSVEQQSVVQHGSVPVRPTDHSFNEQYVMGHYRGHVHRTSHASEESPIINSYESHRISNHGTSCIAQCSETSNELDYNDMPHRHDQQDIKYNASGVLDYRDVTVVSRENSPDYSASGVNQSEQTVLPPRVPLKEECSIGLAMNSNFRIGEEQLNLPFLSEEIYNQYTQDNSFEYRSNSPVQQDESLQSYRYRDSRSTESPWEKLVKELQKENDDLTAVNQRQATFIKKLLNEKTHLESRLCLREVEPGNILEFDHDLYSTQLRTFEEDVKAERNEKELAIAESESLKIQLKTTRDELILAQVKLAELENHIDRSLTERFHPTLPRRPTGDGTAVLCEDDRILNSADHSNSPHEYYTF